MQLGNQRRLRYDFYFAKLKRFGQRINGLGLGGVGGGERLHRQIHPVKLLYQRVADAVALHDDLRRLPALTHGLEAGKLHLVINLVEPVQMHRFLRGQVQHGEHAKIVMLTPVYADGVLMALSWSSLLRYGSRFRYTPKHAAGIVNELG